MIYLINSEQARQVGNLNHVGVLQALDRAEHDPDFMGTFPEVAEAIGYGSPWTVANAAQALATRGLVEFVGRDQIRTTESGCAMVHNVGVRETLRFLARAGEREDVQAMSACLDGGRQNA